MKKAVVLLLCAALVTVVGCNSSTNAEKDVLASTTAHDESEEHEEGEYELAMAMGHLQRFAGKLWFAGSQENWELSAFYAHELEEVMEEVIDHDVVDDGKNISQLMEQMALPSLEYMEEIVKAKNSSEFESAYLGLVNACNSCHAISDHGFIEIIVPSTPSITNQNYAPKKPIALEN